MIISTINGIKRIISHQELHKPFPPVEISLILSLVLSKNWSVLQVEDNDFLQPTATSPVIPQVKRENGENNARRNELCS